MATAGHPAAAPAAPSIGPPLRPGRAANAPAWPFLRVGPDGRLYLIYTEKDPVAPGAPAAASAGAATGHGHGAAAAAGTIRAAFLVSSADGGQTWTDNP